MILTKGLDGYWTHYIATYPQNKPYANISDLERFILEKCSSALATQERFTIFQKECQKQVKNGAVLASIPCGLMADLFSLDYSQVDSIKLTGIDTDAKAFTHAKNLQDKYNYLHDIEFINKDAWHLNVVNEYDLITSNGLNLFESSKERLVDLYKQFYQALKPEGKLVTSFLTYPPNSQYPCEWTIEQINKEDLLLEKIVISDILQAHWTCYQTSEFVEEYLKEAGFENIKIIYDTYKTFPTVTAVKH